MNAIEKCRSLVNEIRAAADPFAVVDAWALASRLLARQPAVDAAALSTAIEAKDIDALDAIVSRLENPQAAVKPKRAPTRKVTADEMKDAMRAYRKRLKLARLADESKLGGHKLSGGRKSNIDAIIPPPEFSWEVWDALAAAGKLEDAGKGFYALPESERVKPPEP